MIIGTSLNVYPAAGLLNYVHSGVPVYLIDPKEVRIASGRAVHVIQKGASEGMEELKNVIGNTRLNKFFLYLLSFKLRIDTNYCFNKLTDYEKYICTVCDWVYDPEVGDPEGGIAPGTAFEDIPEDWVCPVCGVGKEDFQVVED